MLTLQQLATLQAALRYWQEEMCPHGVDLMRPYLGSDQIEPLTATEIARVSKIFAPPSVRYVLYRRRPLRLLTTELFPSAEAALQQASPGSAVATVLLRS